MKGKLSETSFDNADTDSHKMQIVWTFILRLRLPKTAVINRSVFN